MNTNVRPDKNVGRFLISTPSKVVGEFEHPGVLVTHAFPNLLGKTPWSYQLSENPYSRSYFVVSTPVKTYKEKGSIKVEPEFDPSLIVVLASIWFGKRFDMHGWIQREGVSFMPYGTELMPTRIPEVGTCNHKPRKDLEVSLDLGKLSVMVKLAGLNEPSSSLGVFWKAANFYTRALRAYENDSEVAFLHLISAIEVLASDLSFSEDKLYDPQTVDDLRRISKELTEGKAIAERVKSRLLQIRRKVVLSAEELTNDAFFAGSESGHKAFALTKENLAIAVQAAYDVRSSYVHGGARFSVWLDPLVMQNEIQVGEPVLPESEEELAKLLAKIPTFLGLERLVRFMTLRFAHLKVRWLHPRLD